MSNPKSPPPKARLKNTLRSASAPLAKRRKLAPPPKPPKPTIKPGTLSLPKPSKTKRITLLPHSQRPRRRPASPPHTTPSTSATATAITTPRLAISNAATPAATAHARLAALANLLDLLAQLLSRNRNQHRAQPWFKHASILGRWLRRLYEAEREVWELRYGGGVVGVGGSGVRGGEGNDMAEGNKTSGGGGAAEQVRRRFEREAKLEKRKAELEEWVREQVVPELWVRATGLVGDGQFAGVGLVLVSLVSEVRSFVGGMRVRAREEGERSVAMVGQDAEEANDQAMRAEEGTKEDVGEVVKRPAGTVEDSGSGMQRDVVMDERELAFDAGDANTIMDRPEQEPFPDTSSPFASSEDHADEEEHERDPPMETQPHSTTRPPTEHASPSISHTSKPAFALDQDLTRSFLQQHPKNTHKEREGGQDHDTLGHIYTRSEEKSKKETNYTATQEVGAEKKGAGVGEKASKIKAKPEDKKNKENQKSKSKSKGKGKRKANAIDDLFAGFG